MASAAAAVNAAFKGDWKAVMRILTDATIIGDIIAAGRWIKDRIAGVWNALTGRTQNIMEGVMDVINDAGHKLLPTAGDGLDLDNADVVINKTLSEDGSWLPPLFDPLDFGFQVSPAGEPAATDPNLNGTPASSGESRQLQTRPLFRF